MHFNLKLAEFIQWRLWNWLRPNQQIRKLYLLFIRMRILFRQRIQPMPLMRLGEIPWLNQSRMLNLSNWMRELCRATSVPAMRVRLLLLQDGGIAKLCSDLSTRHLLPISLLYWLPSMYLPLWQLLKPALCSRIHKNSGPHLQFSLLLCLNQLSKKLRFIQ